MVEQRCTSGWLWLCAFLGCAIAATVLLFAPPEPYFAVAVLLASASIYFLLVYMFASVAYREKWLQHTLAPLTGSGMNQHLLRDFWEGEDLWSPSERIQNRWRKLLFVHLMAAGTQLVVPTFLVGAVLLTVGKMTLPWFGVVALAGVAFGVLLAVGFATWDFYRLAHQST